MSKKQELDTNAEGQPLTPERFARVRTIFEASIERPPAERRAYAAGACAGDAALLREVEAMLAAEDQTNTLLPREHSSSSSTSHEEGRFPAGTVLAGRYRILGLLGRGGMGEVYKAFDLILNQVVALKFLNPAHVSEAALVRFRNEVRIARQVSHPNVCRVYDLGMVEGLHFLSMEYIDGEDLASLLRRIGRLPQDKAMEFTRKICAGLGAAHERGVLHRDLKPANIMIDGRGQPRITDFGLAGLAAEIPLSDIRSGTPAYMSPEQKAGKEVTTRSDLYSLGLVLHEMFTGKQRAVGTQTNPSEIVKDLDPAIERLILRCLDEDPKRRPLGAFNVALALPGADPVAAALAAGETPSPEMVAASQEKEGFSARTAILCFVGVILCLAGGAFLSDRYLLLGKAPLTKPPEVLTERAQQILAELGYTAKPVDTASGFTCCHRTAEAAFAKLDSATQDRVLASHRPAVIHYWYRQSDQSFGLGDGRFNAVTEYAPETVRPGMLKVDVDPTGRLLRLLVIPTWMTSGATDPDWSKIFTLAGLEFTNFMEVQPVTPSPVAGDRYFAWRGVAKGDWKEPITVQAATWKGKVVWFEAQPSPRPIEFAFKRGWFGIYYLISFSTMLLMALWNWRAGRVDGKGATLFAGFLLVTRFLTGAEENSFVFACVGLMNYAAMEPYLRRYWPDSMISWSRVLRGQFRNTLVASHVLAGMVAGAAFGYLFFTSWDLLGPSPLPVTEAIGRSLSETNALRGYLGTLVESPIVALRLLFLVVVFRLALRRLWAADLLAVAIFSAGDIATGFYVGEAPHLILMGVLLAVPSLAWIALIRKFGLLSFMVLFSFGRASTFTILSTSGWLAERTWYAHAIIVVLAAWCLWVILSATRPKQGEMA